MSKLNQCLNDQYALLKQKLALKLQLKISEANGKIFKLPHIFRSTLSNHDNKYLIYKGGRGSGKTFASIAFAIEESYREYLTNCCILVCREIQKSVSESVHAVVKDLIAQANLSNDFKVTDTFIRNNQTGCTIIFTGLRSTGGATQFSQVNKLKGKHKIKLIIGDESQDFSEDSLNVLFPTVNRSGEIKLEIPVLKEKVDLSDTRFVFCMNPNFAVDPVVAKVEKFSNSLIEHVNIFDIEEEFQDKQLLEQAAAEKKEVYYNHVWLGEASHKISGYPFAQVKLTQTNNKFDCIAFIDPSFRGGDYTAITFLSVFKGQIVFWGMCFKRSWQGCFDDMANMIKEYQPRETWYESNALGLAPQQYFRERGIKIIDRDSIDNKENRIYKAAGFIAHRSFMVTNRCNTQYMKHVTEYHSDADFDDAPDSLASAAIVAGQVYNKTFKAKFGV